MSNTRLAVRMLAKTPMVCSAAIVSLGLGIGAAAAIASLFNQVLVRPLPLPEPHRLVNLSAPGPKSGSQSSNQAGPSQAVFSYLMFRDLERAQQVFTGIAAHRLTGANIGYSGTTVHGDLMVGRSGGAGFRGARGGLRAGAARRASRPDARAAGGVNGS